MVAHPHPLTARLRRTRLLAVICGLLLFGGQALTQNHLHDNAAPAPDCVVCALAKSQTAAPAALPALAVSDADYLPVPAPAAKMVALHRHPRFEARAPPAVRFR